jgi:hypothetical protein
VIAPLPLAVAASRPGTDAGDEGPASAGHGRTGRVTQQGLSKLGCGIGGAKAVNWSGGRLLAGIGGQVVALSGGTDNICICSSS